MTALLALALAVAPVPSLTGPVVDPAGALSSAERARLGAALERYKQTTGNQLQVLIVASLEGDAIDEYSMRVAEAWKLGSAERDNGVLLVLAMEDRAWRIEVGGGLEGQLTDVQAARIGRGMLVPHLRAGQVADGIATTLQAIAGALGTELALATGQPTSGAPRAERPVRTGLGTLLLLAFLFFVLFGGRGARSFAGGMLLGHLLGRGSRGGWGGGRGGFGGGWRGGGGGFSGGGASGRW